MLLSASKLRLSHRCVAERTTIPSLSTRFSAYTAASAYIILYFTDQRSRQCCTIRSTNSVYPQSHNETQFCSAKTHRSEMITHRSSSITQTGQPLLPADVMWRLCEVRKLSLRSTQHHARENDDVGRQGSIWSVRRGKSPACAS